MNYLELLQFAAPEAIVAVTALVVLTVGLIRGRRATGATLSIAGSGIAGDTAAAPPMGICTAVAALGLALGVAVVMWLPQHATFVHGMLVISPLNSLFKVIVLLLAFLTILLARAEHSLPSRAQKSSRI